MSRHYYFNHNPETWQSLGKEFESAATGPEHVEHRYILSRTSIEHRHPAGILEFMSAIRDGRLTRLTRRLLWIFVPVHAVV